MSKIGRNDPCPCGSGKKFKQCCFVKSLPKTLSQRRFNWVRPEKKEVGEENIKALPDLMERTYGRAIEETSEASFLHQSDKEVEEKKGPLVE